MITHFNKPSIQTTSPECLGIPFSVLQVGSPSVSAAAYPHASGALCQPFTLIQPGLVRRIFVANGNSISGNCDMGIYTLGGTRIVSSGSVAQTGTSILQFFDTTDVYLSPGTYLMAYVLNNNSGKNLRYNVTLILQQHMGMLKIINGFPLPATASFSSVSGTYIPHMGLEFMGIT